MKHGAAEHCPWGLDVEQLTAALHSGNPIIHDGDEWHFHCGWGSFVYCVCRQGDVELLDLYVQTVGTEALHQLDSRHCRSKEPAFVDRLIAHGVSANNVDWFGRTSLHYAAEDGEVAIASRLLENGADIDAVDLRERTTPLGYAARKAQADMVRFLLDQGANPAAPEDREWARPLAYAQLEGHAAVAAMLRERGD